MHARHVLTALLASLFALPGFAGDTDEATETRVINGCPVWPYTRCPGADLRHADLSAKDLSGADFPDRGPDERVPLLDPDGAGEVRAEEPLAPPHLEPRSPAVLPEARRQERVQQLRLAQVALLERLERRERGPEDEVRRLVRRRRGSGGGRQEEARQEQAEGREDSQTSP